MLRRMFGGGKQDERPMVIYEAIVAASRQPGFYEKLGIPDTLEGRFELLVLHGSLVTNRLRAGSEDAKAMSQGVFDHMFKILDHSLREMGVGDTAVPKRMRRMAEAYYGRTKAYGVALNEEAPEDALKLVIARNVFDSDPETSNEVDEQTTLEAPDDAVVEALSTYMKTASLALSQTDEAAILAGKLAFPDIENFAAELELNHG